MADFFSGIRSFCVGGYVIGTFLPEGMYIEIFSEAV